MGWRAGGNDTSLHETGCKLGAIGSVVTVTGCMWTKWVAVATCVRFSGICGMPCGNPSIPPGTDTMTGIWPMPGTIVCWWWLTLDACITCGWTVAQVAGIPEEGIIAMLSGNCWGTTVGTKLLIILLDGTPWCWLGCGWPCCPAAIWGLWLTWAVFIRSCCVCWVVIGSKCIVCCNELLFIDGIEAVSVVGETTGDITVGKAALSNVCVTTPCPGRSVYSVETEVQRLSKITVTYLLQDSISNEILLP